jgi:hypothetical protein
MEILAIVSSAAGHKNCSHAVWRFINHISLVTSVTYPDPHRYDCRLETDLDLHTEYGSESRRPEKKPKRKENSQPKDKIFIN